MAKSTPYRITLSGGKKVVVESHNAAEAIEKALRDNRGHKVTQCYSGLTEKDCDDIRLMDHDARPMPGYILHDIPPHDPIPKHAVFPVAKRAVDATAPMFDEESIRFESERAKAAGARPMSPAKPKRSKSTLPVSSRARAFPTVRTH